MVATDNRCVVLLHGKGQGAARPSIVEGLHVLRPGGNGPGWGGREWRYFPDERYEQMKASLTRALDAAGCTRAVLQGFSNGAAAAAKLYCRGEDFGGRVAGYMIDDPVTDAAVIGCRPRDGVLVRLYWSGALAFAAEGWSCDAQDWTCEGGRSIGIGRYARELGVEAVPSTRTDHVPQDTPADVLAWLGPR